ncbi:MAG: amidohydrolase family protein [Clostridiales bacterium]|nr:amidohydrolase family protein [Clostridiales bacterium]
MDGFVLKGDICWSESPNEIKAVADGYAACLDGACLGVFQSYPESLALPLVDMSGKLVIPGMVDLHVHAPQYPFRGLGLDLELLEWLGEHTFAEEGKYGDLEYASRAYKIFVDDLAKGPNTRACVFATVHEASTLALMDAFEKSGMVAYVGKVNMDRNCPGNLLEESAEASLEATKRVIEGSSGYSRVKPMLTPRFVPTCSDELLRGLGELSERLGLALQSHLSENKSEIEWVKRLCPWSESYTDAYWKLGCLNSRTVMAHCVWCTDFEMDLISKSGAFVAHCPQSNINLSSGVAPITQYMEAGLNVGLGSDVAGGCHTSMLRAMTDAVQASKLRWRLFDQSVRPLRLEEAFYLATKGGGRFFGKVGSFEPGYEFDAVVLDDSEVKSPFPMNILDRLARAAYFCDSVSAICKWARGKRVAGA